MPIPSGWTVDLTGPGIPGTTLHAGQVSLGDVIFGAVDAYGVEWILEGLTGWSDAPPTTGTVEQRANDHGGWLSPAFYAPRVVEITGSLIANNWSGASQAIDRLMGSIPLNLPAPLVVFDDDRILQADVRQEGDPLVERRGEWARYSVSLLARDPRRYSFEATTARTGMPQTAGGLSLPLSLPLSVGASTTSGVLTVVNDGNMATRPMFTVFGPCPPFSITHRGTGRTLSSTESLAAGRSLTIDTDRRTALLDGTATRVVTGSWFEYDPGVNEVAFSAATYDPSALLVSTHRSAWR